MQDHATSSANPAARYVTRKKVVIVDDSRAIRAWLRMILEQDQKLEVVGEADSALAARQVIRETKPDVVTLDIEMPGMNGLDFLEKLMQLHPMPVVMISGTTKTNSEATITALTLGAVDCIVKPSSATDSASRRDITRRVFSAACSLAQFNQMPQVSPQTRGNGVIAHKMPLILIGASTGGIVALERVLADLHVDGPPVVIVQHMPGAFLVSFAQFLNKILPQDVGVARVAEPLSAGQIRLAPSLGQHTEIQRNGLKWSCSLAPDTDKSLHCPSVDVLFHSAKRYSQDIIGVILSGLGRDGAEGLLQLHKGGAQTIGQDMHSSIVYGMPRAAWDLGAVGIQLPLQKIGDAVNRAVAQHASRSERKTLH